VSGSPDLRLPGIRLRRWTEADADAVLALARDGDGSQWSRSLRQVHDLTGAREWLQAREGPGRVEWAAVDTASGEVMGRVHLFDVDRDAVTEIGYAVWPGHRRRGLATTMVAAATRFAFEDRGYRRVELVHALGNPASCAVATRCGFAFEGIQRAALDHGDGVAHDAHLHARLADDPPGPAAATPEPLPSVELTVDDLVLRPWRRADAPSVLAAFGDPEVVRWRVRSAMTGIDDALRWIVERSQRQQVGEATFWAVERDGVVVGSIGLRGINRVDRQATVSYWTLPGARRTGVASCALGRVASYAFGDLGLHRVQLGHAVANTASCGVAERAGFRLEGTKRGSNLLDDGFADEHWHARLAGDT
jgi:RimJ/RimL family protein N-acetyltransferase